MPVNFFAHPLLRSFPISPSISAVRFSQLAWKMGKALNINQSGIFLETTDRVLSESISMMSVDARNNLIEINGQVVYPAERSNGQFGAGVRFKGSQAENIHFAIKLVKAYNSQKYKTAPALNL